MLLRMFISERDIQNLTLDTVPDTVHGLKKVLRSKLLRDCFNLQYEDNNFSQDKATLKILFSPFSIACITFSINIDSVSSSFSEIKQSRSHPWPAVFTIPTFSYDVELRIKHGNEAYSTDGTRVFRDVRGFDKWVMKPLNIFNKSP